MIKWPERAKVAIPKLFEPLQKLDVYVEDANDEAFYSCLFSKIPNCNVQIARVFALGGRTAVIDAAARHDHAKRRALFIIDGDLPWVKGALTPQLIGLHQHDAYCIENLLLCEQAISTIISEEIVITEDEAMRRLDYSQWCHSVSAPLVELFAAFATVHDCDPTIPTVSHGVGVMCVKHSTGITELDPAKVRRARDDALKAASAAVAVRDVTSRYLVVLARLTAMHVPLRAISGKDFLLPLLDFHLRSLGCQVKRKSLRRRLAGAGDLSRFSDLGTALNLAARG